MNFTANITDDINLANVTLYIYNKTGLVNQTTETYTGTEKIIGIVVTLLDDTYTWFMEVRDAANNLFTSENRTLTIDTSVVYALDITDPTTGDPESVTGGDNITITFDFTQDGANKTTDVTMENVTIGGSFADIVTTSSCTGTLDCSVYVAEDTCTNCSQCDWSEGGASSCTNDGDCASCSTGECDTNCSAAGCSISETEQFDYFAGTGWQVNVTVPTNGFSGLEDLFLNATWGGFSRWETETNSIDFGGDTCTCAGLNNNWEIDLSDFCNINDACDLGTGTLSFTGNGFVNCNAKIETTNMGDPGSLGTININSSGEVIVI